MRVPSLPGRAGRHRGRCRVAVVRVASRMGAIHAPCYCEKRAPESSAGGRRGWFSASFRFGQRGVRGVFLHADHGSFAAPLLATRQCKSQPESRVAIAAMCCGHHVATDHPAMSAGFDAVDVRCHVSRTPGNALVIRALSFAIHNAPVREYQTCAVRSRACRGQSMGPFLSVYSCYSNLRKLFKALLPPCPSARGARRIHVGKGRHVALALAGGDIYRHFSDGGDAVMGEGVRT